MRLLLDMRRSLFSAGPGAHDRPNPQYEFCEEKDTSKSHAAMLDKGESLYVGGVRRQTPII